MENCGYCYGSFYLCMHEGKLELNQHNEFYMLVVWKFVMVGVWYVGCEEKIVKVDGEFRTLN